MDLSCALSLSIPTEALLLVTLLSAAVAAVFVVAACEYYSISSLSAFRKTISTLFVAVVALLICSVVYLACYCIIANGTYAPDHCEFRNTIIEGVNAIVDECLLK